MRLLATLTAAAAVVLLANTPAIADDTELFVGAAVAAPPSRPNILFVLDTSGSMDTNVTTQVSFDPADTTAAPAGRTGCTGRKTTGRRAAAPIKTWPRLHSPAARPSRT